MLLFEVVQCSSAAAIQLTSPSPYDCVFAHVAGCGSILDVLQQRMSPVLRAIRPPSTNTAHECPKHLVFQQLDVLPKVQSLMEQAETATNNNNENTNLTARSIEDLQLLHHQVENATTAGVKTCAPRLMWLPFLFGV